MQTGTTQTVVYVVRYPYQSWLWHWWRLNWRHWPSKHWCSRCQSHWRSAGAPAGTLQKVPPCCTLCEWASCILHPGSRCTPLLEGCEREHAAVRWAAKMFERELGRKWYHHVFTFPGRLQLYPEHFLPFQETPLHHCPSVRSQPSQWPLKHRWKTGWYL